MATPIEYLERRIAELKREEPVSKAGRDALQHTIHELQNIVMAFRLEALNGLHDAITDSLDDPGVEIH